MCRFYRHARIEKWVLNTHGKLNNRLPEGFQVACLLAGKADTEVGFSMVWTNLLCSIYTVDAYENRF
ncbi:phosphatidylglycerophosphatase B-like protein [Neisseria shayeganii 871]|uniref:Phosphatidylglycerophosphatase B-like protein n=1 Tax=Neisseria shayeganii 871 TaxID=1032488 RepID=G4CEZ5_9NEIS|nr:phosphatidylglycerophosphatase B-like protein [Neisseria shayeganii 871]